MKIKILTTLILLSFLVVAFSSYPVQATNGDLIQLGLCIDGSGSIYSSDFTIMINGIAAAIRNNLPHDGTVELCVIQFADNGPAVVEISPTIIDSDATAETVATAVEGITHLLEMTSMADGVWLTWDVMKGSPNFVAEGKQIINLATDGYPNELLSLAPGTTGNSDDDVVLVVGWAVAEGLDELDAEAISPGSDVAWLRDYVVYPQPGYETPPFAGPGWVRYVDTFEEFADTIGEKFDIIVPQEKDVQAVSQSASEVEVIPGESVDIDVTVRNNGPDPETFDVTCKAEGITIGTIRVTDMAPGETRVITFTWDTTEVPQGTYSIKAWVDSSAEITEVDETNNECTMPLKLFVIPEVPLGTIVAACSMFLALVGYVGFKRYGKK